MRRIEQLASEFRVDALGRVANNQAPRGCREVYEFLCHVIDALGGSVEFAGYPWEEFGGGSLQIQPGGKPFTVRLPRDTPPLRDNFTLAHELGHLLLHYRKADAGLRVAIFNRHGTDLKEAQANRFAAAFLMPADEFKAARASFHDDPYALAGHFGVSQPAVTVRMGYV